MANLFESEAPHIHIVSLFAMIVLVVWSANGDGHALTYKASSNSLNEDTYRSICVGNHPSKQIEQSAYYIILNLLNEESVSGEAVVELVYK